MVQARLLTLTRGVRSRMALTALLGVCISGTYIGQGLLVAGMVRRVLAGAPWAAAGPALSGIASLIVLRGILIGLREWSAMFTASAVKRLLRRRLYARLLELGPGYMAHARTGEVQSALVDGVEALEGYFGNYVPHALVALVVPLTLIAYLFTVDPSVAWLLLTCGLLALSAPRLWDRLLGEYGRSHWQAYARTNAQFLDSMQGMSTLKAFGASTRRGRELEREAQDLYHKTMAQFSVSLISTGIVGFSMGAGTALAAGVGVVRFLQGNMTLSELFAILFLAVECFRPLVELDQYWHQGYRGITAAGNLFALLDASPSVTERPDAVAVGPERIDPAIALEDVTFAYRAGAPVLRGLTLTIAPGETVALVGPSGAGKTTVVSLLLRFFDPQEGRITLGGRDARDYTLASLRDAIAVVSQDAYLFYGSVADNLRVARPGATDEMLVSACRLANAHEFIATLPQGYQTIVGERGLNLSGGQRQRIAIARAILKDAPILILDEATSNLDAANEAEIREALARLQAGRTTLVITHRLSTVTHADRIVVLAGGRAVETGRHADLLALQGAYARLVAAEKEARRA